MDVFLDEVLNLGTIDILGQVIFCYGSCPVYGRVAASLGSIPQTPIAPPSPNYEQKSILRYCQMYPRCAK